MPKVEKSEQEWRGQLTPEQYEVVREKGTEAAFSGEYWDAKEDGVYRCVACGESLFHSDHKFDSGTGWPSFHKPIDGDSIDEEDDHSLMGRRTEVMCSNCGAHLGHIFPDGPKPTGQRYCINSCSLDLEEQ